MARVTKEALATNLARARLIIKILEKSVAFDSLYLTFIDSTLHSYYGKEQWEKMLEEQLKTEQEKVYYVRN